MTVVCVGSRNPSKVRGVEKAFRYLIGETSIKSYAVRGLIDQPIGLKTIMESARHRARNVYEIDRDCDFYVGVEAGFVEIERVGFFDVHVACIIDRSGAEFYGLSSAFLIPKVFVDRILSGEFRELEEVVDRYFDTKAIGEKGGFISILTRGVVLREDLVFHAVVSALIPLINRDLYLGGTRT